MFGLIALLFVVIFGVVIGCIGLGTYYFKSKQKQQIRSMLQKAEATPVEQRSELIRPASGNDRLAQVLARFRPTANLELLLRQAGKDWTPNKLVAISCLTTLIGLMAGLKFSFFGPQLTAAVLAAATGSVPLLLVLRKRSKMLSAFEAQFPDALDFLSRSMRAGHGFSIALEMLSADAPEPLGTAFRQISNDLQLGSSLDVAFAKLVRFVPLLDVRFFVSSVLLQQETGGNLGEILTKLAHVIRERFRIKGQVKAASAHGRITGLVLILMPVGVAAFMMMTTPQYLRELITDSTGRILLYGAIGGQVVGYFVIRKIINIKV